MFMTTLSKALAVAAAALAFTGAAQAQINLSQGHSATAFSVQGTSIADNCTDGSLTTRWTAASGAFPQWWRVDLG